MWKLPLPDDSERMNELSLALTYKNGDPKYILSEAEKDKIEGIYALYHQRKAVPCDELLGAEMSTDTKDALKSAYSEVQQAGRLSTLRSTIFLSAKKCPLCGIEATTDLDHYLPESKYKCLSIYARNLIPTCHKCNNKKRAGVTEDGIGFIHAYYFEEPNAVFFVAETEVKEGALLIDFKIKMVEGMTQNLFRSLNFQMEKINLNERLKLEANDFLGGLYISIDLIYQSSGSDGLRMFLKKSRDDYTKRYGLNHWKRALMDSLSDNQEFLNAGFIPALGTP
ncbi:HNH endonuclease [Serratia fonticola]|uniref:HNH endonuclease n=1 Tax=Serratia fonticola TaxID=47917 RepID=UPI0034C6D757